MFLHSACSKTDFRSGFPVLSGSDPARLLGVRALVTDALSLQSLVSDWKLVSISASFSVDECLSPTLHVPAGRKYLINMRIYSRHFPL